MIQIFDVQMLRFITNTKKLSCFLNYALSQGNSNIICFVMTFLLYLKIKNSILLPKTISDSPSFDTQCMTHTHIYMTWIQRAMLNDSRVKWLSCCVVKCDLVLWSVSHNTKPLNGMLNCYVRQRFCHFKARYIFSVWPL